MAMAMSAEEISWISKVFRKIDMFSTLNIGDVSMLIDHMQRYHYPRGKKIVKQGEQGDAFFIIYKGRVKAIKRQWLLFSKVLGELKSEQFFGEMALLAEAPRSASVVALEDTD